MGMVHEQFSQSKDLSKMDFAEYIENLAHHLLDADGIQAAGVTFETNIASSSLKINTAVPCKFTIYELVTNFLKYALRGQTQGKIKINFTRTLAEFAC